MSRLMGRNALWALVFALGLCGTGSAIAQPDDAEVI